MLIAVIVLVTIILFIQIALLIFGFEHNQQFKKLSNLKPFEELLKSFEQSIDESIDYLINEISNMLDSHLKCSVKDKSSQIPKDFSVELDRFCLFFITPYDGYLSVEAKECELEINHTGVISPKNEKLENLYIGQSIPVNITVLKDFRSVKFIRANKYTENKK